MMSYIAVPSVAFIVTLAISWAIREFLLIRLVRLSKKTASQLDDIIIEAIKTPSLIWCLMLAIYLALQFSQLSELFVVVAGKVLLVLGVISVMLVIANITTRSIKTYSSKIESALPVTSLTENIARLVIFAVGTLIILNSLGISITPILATLGVGGLAVALGLQETLSNLFSGFYITIARQMKVGDYVKLDSGEEGYITDINWRVTKIRMLPNNVVLVPNAKLTQSIVTNYYLPDKEMAVLVNLGVHYDSDLARVEKVTCEVGREVLKSVQGGVAGFEPFIRYHTFGDFSINFTVILRVREFVDQYLVKHEFVKRLHERYKKEGIIIPYPIRTINHAQEKAQ
ncbi:MAG: mechanosensitive ion channel family protein [Candidatus Omnitrophica bacterium]|nr:mechanosensitive ion channel family protein [Candidatus Omnitrophota bacterium]